MTRYCIGIDLGGSFVKVGLLNGDNKPGKPMEFPTPTVGGSRAVVDQMIAGARALMTKHGLTKKDIVGVGIGTPGPLKISEGIIIASPNIPGMVNVPVRQWISKGLGLPAVLENDANAAGFGEFLCGTGKGVGNMVLLTLGTGVGGGIVVDGKVVRGGHEVGAELGHMLVQPGGEQCNCGQKGCLERYSSATFMALRAQRVIEKGRSKSSLKPVLKKNGSLTAKDINAARKAGDELAGKVWGEACYYLAVACVNIARILDPEEIVLGGGMAAAGKDLLAPVKQYFKNMTWTIAKERTTVELARLGNDAGFIGAAGVAWQTFGKK